MSKKNSDSLVVALGGLMCIPNLYFIFGAVSNSNAPMAIVFTLNAIFLLTLAAKLYDEDEGAE